MTEEHRLQRLLNELINGSISAEDFAEVQETLRRSPEARAEYYDLLGLDQMLTEHFEVPGHIALHAQAVDNSWAMKRFRNRLVGWSLAGAAAILILTLLTFFVVRLRQQDVPFTASADTHLTVDGAVLDDGDRRWKPGQTLGIAHGVVVLALNPYVEACVEGPATLRLRDHSGAIDMLGGKAFFQVAPGGRGFEVHVPGAVLRDIGTKFGVEVDPDRSLCEVHVGSGLVEIRRAGTSKTETVGAGSAVRWIGSAGMRELPMDTDRFIQSLPWESELFRDDFSEPNGTRMSGKQPDVGQAWLVSREANPTLVIDGVLDTSFGPRSLTAGFRQEPMPGRRSIYLLTLQTTTPRNTEDKTTKIGGTEDIIVWARDGNPIFSLSAAATGGHLWHLKDPAGGEVTGSSGVSALGPRVLTLRYDPSDGRVSLHDGATAQGEVLAEIQARPEVAPAFFTVENSYGGDVALDHVSARVVSYPRKSGKAD